MKEQIKKKEESKVNQTKLATRTFPSLKTNTTGPMMTN